MVEDCPADTSELAVLEPVESLSVKASTGHWEAIEEPLQLPSAVILSNAPSLSEDASRLLSWLSRKASENYEGFWSAFLLRLLCFFLWLCWGFCFWFDAQLFH